MADAAAAPAVLGPEVIALGAALLEQGIVIPSFAQFAITGEDNLRIISIGSIDGLTATIQGRFLDAPTQKILPFNLPFTTPTGRVITTNLFALGTGYLLNLTAVTLTPIPTRSGEHFVMVQIVRGLSGAITLVGTIIAGYVTTTQTLAWPGSPVRYSQDGAPARKDLQLGAMALGAELSILVPVNVVWEIVSVFAQFTTGVAVPTRNPVLILTDSNNPLLSAVPTVAAQPANSVFDYCWQPGAPQAASADGFVTSPLPTRLTLQSGQRLITQTSGLAAADRWNIVNVFVKEWLDF